jgi:hypothetical protein
MRGFLLGWMRECRKTCLTVLGFIGKTYAGQAEVNLEGIKIDAKYFPVLKFVWYDQSVLKVFLVLARSDLTFHVG